MSTVIAVANAKGGVGKTTTVATLTHLYAQRGFQVTAVDCDPQGDLTTSFGYSASDLPPEATIAGPLYRHLHSPPSGPTLAEVAVALTERGGIHLVPSNREVARVIKMVEADPFGVGAAARMMTEYVDSTHPDVVLLDVPPTLGTYVLSLLTAADWVVVPVSPDIRAFRGLETVLSSVAQLHSMGQTSRLKVAGAFLTHYDRSTKLSKEADEFMAGYRRQVKQFTSIPRSVKLSDAAIAGRPVTEYAPTHTTAQSYEKLASEIAKATGLKKIRKGAAK